MNPGDIFRARLREASPVLALAPMQDVTDGAFWQLMHQYGGADVYWTEYFRVHAVSRLEKWIVDSIRQNRTGRPVVAQMIGNDIPALVRTAKELQHLPVAAIDLNLGCPAPIVYRKCAGGGLLREPQRIDAILGALREAVTIPFTVKTRIGFTAAEEFDVLLPIFARHSLDALTVHARTVVQMYRLPVHYRLIRQASEALPCPVLANGHVYSARQARALLIETKGHPQSLVVQSDPPATPRRRGDLAHRTRSSGLHPGVVGIPGQLCRAGKNPMRAHEEVPELSG
jgi:tRNA-dihydrouridine synthase